MKKDCSIKSCVLIAFSLLVTSVVMGQQVWTFDGTCPLRSSDSTATMQLRTVKSFPEYVKGIRGNGVRTDGYSTWLSVDSVDSQQLSTLSGWFALESFPTDTATFIGVKSRHGNVSISLCCNRFGALVLEKEEGARYSYHSLNARIERFKWLNLALSLQADRVIVYFNGEEVGEVPFSIKALNQGATIHIGKGFREKKVWMYDVTTINGLIDEVMMDSKPLDRESLRAEVALLACEVPQLAIPENRFVADFNRPRFHLLPGANWTNETHGLLYYKDSYHLFNQKNASGIFLGQINWGHFSSPDLIHWTEEKPALTPDRVYDKNGIWSGCAVINDEGIPQLLYTAGGDKMGVGIAFPKDERLIAWEKYEHNPVIASQPAGYERTDMRDQYVWKENNVWYMIIGFGVGSGEDARGALLLYQSSDLKQWNYLHLLFEGNPAVDHSGVFWEMPVFKKIGSKYILQVNRVPHNGVPARSQYWVGEFKNERFVPDHPVPQNLEVINRLLSPSVVETSDGLITALAIIPDEIGGEATYEQGWAHLYSMPRVWTLKNGKIAQTPHPAMQQLRNTHSTFKRQKVTASHPYVVSQKGHQLELRATFYPGDAKKYGFILCKNPDGSEYTSLYYDVAKQELVVDQTHSSLRKHIPLTVRKDRYCLAASAPVEIRLFIDGSVVEGFINNEDAFTTRIFPLKEGSTQVELFSDGNTTEAEADVWMLNAAKVQMNY